VAYVYSSYQVRVKANGKMEPANALRRLLFVVDSRLREMTYESTSYECPQSPNAARSNGLGINRSVDTRAPCSAVGLSDIMRG